MTALAVAACQEGLRISTEGGRQAAVSRTMAVRTVGEMRGCIDQGIRMTARTVIGAGSRHKCAVIRCTCMDRTPGAAVTRRTVAAGGEVCRISAVGGYPAAVRIMTGAAGVMRLRISTGQRIGAMTSGAIGSGYLHKTRMIRRVHRIMGGLPT